MERLREMLKSSSVRRGLIGLYVVLLAVTIAVFIGASLLDVRTAVFFRGADTLHKERTNAVRGVVLNAKKGQYRRDVEVDFFLNEADDGGDDEEGALDAESPLARLGSAAPDAEGIVHASLTIPESIEPGTYRLGIRASGPSIDTYTAGTDVEVAAPSDEEELWLPPVTRLADETRQERFESGPVTEQNGPLAVDILPVDGEVSRGLSDTVYVVTYDAETGEPIPATVTFDTIEGIGQWGGQSEMPSQIRTDTLGLAPVQIEAVGGQKWTLTAEERVDPNEEVGRQGTATIEIHTVASKMSLSLERPFAERGGDVTGEIRSLFRSGAISVDLYRGSRWLSASTTPVQARDSRFELPIPNEGGEPWLYRIQLSHGVYGTGDAWDVAHVVIPPSPSKAGMRGGLERLVSLIAEHRDEHAYFRHLADEERIAEVTAGRESLAQWTMAMTGALPRHFSRPETLFNTQKAEREALEAWIDAFQADLMIPIVIALFGGLAVLLYVVIAGWRRKREHDRHLEQIDDELAAEAAESGDGEPEAEPSFEQSGRGEDLLAGLLAVVALAVLAMFGLGLLLLLSYL